MATILILSSIVNCLLWLASPLTGGRFYSGGTGPPAPPPLAPALGATRWKIRSSALPREQYADKCTWSICVTVMLTSLTSFGDVQQSMFRHVTQQNLDNFEERRLVSYFGASGLYQQYQQHLVHQQAQLVAYCIRFAIGSQCYSRKSGVIKLCLLWHSWPCRGSSGLRAISLALSTLLRMLL